MKNEDEKSRYIVPLNATGEGILTWCRTGLTDTLEERTAWHLLIVIYPHLNKSTHSE
jgi:hypothetical protein